MVSQTLRKMWYIFNRVVVGFAALVMVYGVGYGVSLGVSTVSGLVGLVMYSLTLLFVTIIPVYATGEFLLLMCFRYNTKNEG